jgi:hypothetical protein
MILKWWLPLSLLHDSIGWLIRDGSWRLNLLETEAIAAAAATLSEHDQTMLKDQLTRFFYIQRLHKQRLNEIHPYFPEDWPKMNHPERYRIATLSLKSNGGQTRLYVESYKGRIRAIHFRKPPSEIIKYPYFLEVLSTGGTPKDEIQRELNASEHPDLDS